MSRLVAYLVGGALFAYGCWLLLSTRPLLGLWPVVRWLAGGVVVHDGFAVPAALLVGFAVHRYAPDWLRGPLLAGLFASVALTLAAAPFVLGFGRKPDNPSLLPLPYGRNLVVLLAAVWLTVALTAALRALRTRRRRQ